jgi:hypothetical protein
MFQFLVAIKPMFDFANILFSGPCSARCYFCIGREINPYLNQPNLDIFPPRNLEHFIDLLLEYEIRQVVLTGTNSDPQLYRYESNLLAMLRSHLPHGTQISLHTNGRQALLKLSVFNQYDRVSLSFPSFNPVTYHQMMGVPNPPDLAAILSAVHVPVKLSCVVDHHNLPEMDGYLRRCQELGVHRVVLRKLYGDERPWTRLIDIVALGLHPGAVYRGNPVFVYADMEVTLWDFDQSESTSLNLFADGTISKEYLLVHAPAVSPYLQDLPAYTSNTRFCRATNK